MQSKVTEHNAVLLGTGRAERAEPRASIPEPVRSAVASQGPPYAAPPGGGSSGVSGALCFPATSIQSSS